MNTDPVVERLRAVVRPIVVIFSTFILGVLVILQMFGYPIPDEGTASTIVTGFLAITGVINGEYALERGIRHFKQDGVVRAQISAEVKAAPAEEVKTDANS